MIIIRNFNEKEKVSNIKELEETLIKKYSGENVALEYKRPSGLSSVKYIDVSQDGVVTHSYGKEGVFDFAQFKKEVSQV